MRSFYIFLLSLTIFCTKSQGQWLIVGTYDSPKSEGIYVYRFNSRDGTAREISHVKTSNPSFVAISPDNRFVYAVHETAPQDGKGGDIAAFSFNKSNGTLSFINKQRSGGDHPCHVEVDHTGRWLFASNYTSGTLSVLPINEDGSLGTARTIQHSGSGKNPVRQKGPHVHGAIISPDNKKLFVTDLGIDKLMIYSFDETTGELKPDDPPFIASVPGSGPRLFTFSPDKKSAYVVEEFALLAAVMLNSCVKNSHYNSFDESYWLSKERGEVVYSDTYCSYYVVETHFGFTVIQSYGSKPYEGDIMYGNFSSRGTRDIYNRSSGYVISGSITDYWLTYSEAQDALDYYCPLGKAGKRVFKTTTQNQ